MRSHDELLALVYGFETCTLPSSAWSHAEHLLIALWYLRRLPRSAATEAIRSGIRRYNESCGNGAGYHETITLGWIAVVAQFLAVHDIGQPLTELASQLLDQCGDRHYLQRFWSRELLYSAAARASWVPPNLQPL